MSENVTKMQSFRLSEVDRENMDAIVVKLRLESRTAAIQLALRRVAAQGKKKTGV